MSFIYTFHPTLLQDPELGPLARRLINSGQAVLSEPLKPVQKKPEPGTLLALFDGEGLTASDHKRLHCQLEAVRGLMLDGRWRTLPEISQATGAPPASVSARLRDLRKAKFGGHAVFRRRVAGAVGLFEYRVSEVKNGDA